MSEKVVIGDATLYHGDCLAVMREFADQSVNMIWTDPLMGIPMQMAICCRVAMLLLAMALPRRASQLQMMTPSQCGASLMECCWRRREF